ncbi:hypothetical protein ACQEVS_20635 [Streptomyces sp. CA-181903]|uniref:hypothetical protein n=1 Tax=Streptomyces sp. CA-181903 TaxID=3240055 RepID=UPI003D91B451
MGQNASRRRLRSSTVVLGSMGVLAAALTSCGSEPDKRCVDPNSYDMARGYRVLDSKACKNTTSSGSAGSSSGSSGASGRSGTSSGRWYYGADRKSNGYADSGTFSKSQAVDRGGFGCSGSGGG